MEASTLMYLFLPLFNVLSIALLMLSAAMLTPLVLMLDGTPVQYLVYLYSDLITLACAIVLRWLARHQKGRLTQRQLYLITAGSWLVSPVFGMLPFLLVDQPLSVTDAFFETVSGLTTTGSTVITGLDQTPHDILLYRSLLHWIGGIGIIGMAIAILPSLKAGGMKLFRTESSDWSEKSTPRTHSMLSGIISAYVVLTLLCFIAFVFAGMDVFNAVNHSMSALSTGGFSTSDSSFGQFDSSLLRGIATVFMLAGSIPFLLYVQYWHGLNARVFRNTQIYGLLGVFAGVTIVLALDVVITRDMPFWEALSHSSFNVSSILTTTGFASTDYSQWGHASIVTFFFLTFIGGCSGSTAGGVKIFRCQLFFLQLRKQLVKSIHPNAVISSRYGNRAVTEDIMQSCIAFLFLLMCTLIVLSFLLSLTGLDLLTSVTGAATALANVGPGLGDIIGPAGTFKPLGDTAKWLLSFGMILGRLEFIAIMILFTRTFWRG